MIARRSLGAAALLLAAPPARAQEAFPACLASETALGRGDPHPPQRPGSVTADLPARTELHPVRTLTDRQFLPGEAVIIAGLLVNAATGLPHGGGGAAGCRRLPADLVPAGFGLTPPTARA
jgi:hypothetical protein